MIYYELRFKNLIHRNYHANQCFDAVGWVAGMVSGL